jgi:hypothetical protein
MSSSRNKDNRKRLPPFVPLLKRTLDSPAWRAMSFGARALYTSLKRRCFWPVKNTAYLSYREAAAEVGCSKTRVGRWYRELEHFGFIVLAKHGCLGVEGKGKAPHWRLTELGKTPKTSPTGIREDPTNDFMKWDGTPFDPDAKNKIPATRGGQGVHPGKTVVSTPRVHPNSKVVTRRVHTNGRGCPPVGDITRTTTQVEINPVPGSRADTLPELPDFLKRNK